MISKKTDIQIQQITATTHIQEMSENSLAVYTDGSKGTDGQLGIGIVIPKWKVATNFGVPQGASIFTAELVAISKALEIVAQNPPKKVTIFTDSLSSVKTLETDTVGEAPEIVEKVKIITTALIKKDCEVTISWIPAHVRIQGNEKADSEAKKGRTAKDIENMSLSRSENKSIIKIVISRECSAWDNSRKGRHAHNLLKEPSRTCQIKGEHKISSIKKLLRLRLGTAFFTRDEPFCHNCNTKNNIAHYLTECDVHRDMRSELTTYFQARGETMSLRGMLGAQTTKEVTRLVAQYVTRTKTTI
jgi:ribonuclease HI